MKDYYGFAHSCDPQQNLNVRTGVDREDNYAASFWFPYLVFTFWAPLQWFAVWIFPTRNIFHYLTLQPGNPIARALLGGLAHTKIDDPFDMTEAYEEFKFRAEIGAALAKKDHTGDGFVDLDEHERSMSHIDVEVDDAPADLRAFLKALGMSTKYGALADEFELEDLQSLAKKDAALCLIDTHLEKAGVVVGGHRIKIINALVDGLPEPAAADAEPAEEKDVVEPSAAGVPRVRVDTAEKPGCF